MHLLRTETDSVIDNILTIIKVNGLWEWVCLIETTLFQSIIALLGHSLSRRKKTETTENRIICVAFHHFDRSLSHTPFVCTRARKNSYSFVRNSTRKATITKLKEVYLTCTFSKAARFDSINYAVKKAVRTKSFEVRAGSPSKTILFFVSDNEWH